MRHGQQRARVPRDGGGVVIDDPPLRDRPIKPCCRCGDVFQPTSKRRLLCHDCFTYSEDDPVTCPLRFTSSLR